MKINITADVNVADKLDKLREIVSSDALGTFAATEWFRLYKQYMPYTPAAFTIEPWTITHTEPYARYDYYGNVMGPNVYIESRDIWFSPKVPKYLTGAKLVFAKGSSEWDVKAKPSEAPKLAEAIQDYIKGQMGE